MNKIGLRERKKDKWLSFHYRLAHHPLCDAFLEDVYQLFGKKICRGCFMMYAGIIVSAVLLPIFTLQWYGTSPILHLILVYIFFIPTVISAKVKPRRKIRDVTRFFLGFTYTEAVIAIIISFGQKVWWIGILVILTYLTGSTVLTRVREASNNKVCLSCPELNNPRCSGLKDYQERNSIIQGAAIRIDVFSE